MGIINLLFLIINAHLFIKFFLQHNGGVKEEYCTYKQQYWPFVSSNMHQVGRHYQQDTSKNLKIEQAFTSNTLARIGCGECDR